MNLIDGNNILSDLMNSNRFAELLNLYLDNKATGGEREELLQQIRNGHHDEVIRDRIDAMLLHDPAPGEMDSQNARKMLSAIIANEQEKIIPMRRASTNWRWAAAAVLFISVSAGWWLFNTEQVDEQRIVLQEEKGTQPVVFSGKQYVHLPDGSTVLLNEGTKLSYASSFGEQAREVTLTGEGYFDVRHDSSKPFKVLTGKITTTVLGTAFNVRAYPGQDEIEVTVTRGRVQVKDDQRTFGIVTPDQQIAVNTATHDFIQTDLKAETAVAWQSQYLILDNVSLEQAAKTIGEKYSVKIILMNDELKACRISATFLNGEDLDQVLTVVCGVVHATYTMLPDGNAKIEGEGCR